MSLLSFEYTDSLLKKRGSMMTSAEVHGLICGFLCGGKQTDGKNWLESLIGLAEVEPKKDIREMLLALYNFSYAQINSEDFKFDLLLPNDEKPLAMRARLLSSWCQGFLLGVGLTGAKVNETDTEETQEILYHFHDISNLEHESVSVNNNEDEAAFTMLYEYVRMAVLVVYNELTQYYSDKGKMGDTGNLLH